MAKVTYKKSGVDIDKADAFVERIKPIAKATARDGAMKGIGGFGAFFQVPPKYKNPVLVSSTDGVGTKLLIAIEAKHVRGLGIDLVAMNVNDILTCGAEPLFFLDYMAVGKLNPDVMTEVVRGIADGCKQAGCALIGGETAEMPGVYKPHDFDLAGFCVGVVDRRKAISGAAIRPGDAVIGCASNGVHSNGFSFVRKALGKAFIKKNAEEILRPTRIYVKPMLALAKKGDVLGMAHITGGGLYDKLRRVLPAGTCAQIDLGSWRMPRVFKWLQEASEAPVSEMYRTFNMGIGYCVVTRREKALKTVSALKKLGVESWIVGKITKGEGVKIQ